MNKVKVRQDEEQNQSKKTWDQPRLKAGKLASGRGQISLPRLPVMSKSYGFALKYDPSKSSVSSSVSPPKKCNDHGGFVIPHC